MDSYQPLKGVGGQGHLQDWMQEWVTRPHLQDWIQVWVARAHLQDEMQVWVTRPHLQDWMQLWVARAVAGLDAGVDGQVPPAGLDAGVGGQTLHLIRYSALRSGACAFGQCTGCRV